MVTMAVLVIAGRLESWGSDSWWAGNLLKREALLVLPGHGVTFLATCRKGVVGILGLPLTHNQRGCLWAEGFWTDLGIHHLVVAQLRGGTGIAPL